MTLLIKSKLKKLNNKFVKKIHIICSKAKQKGLGKPQNLRSWLPLRGGVGMDREEPSGAFSTVGDVQVLNLGMGSLIFTILLFSLA